MASILKVGDRWRAQIRRAGNSTSKTFRTKAAAEKWASGAEIAIEDASSRVAMPLLQEVIKSYRKVRKDSGREITATSNEHYMLLHLDAGLGDVLVDKLDTTKLVEWCGKRKKEGAGRYTLNMEISKLGTVIRHTKSLLGLKVGDAVADARPTLIHYGLVGPGNKRDRRPTVVEIKKLLEWFAAYNSSIPMADIIIVSMICAFRRGEIFRILWADLDEEKKMVLVRERKDPRHKTDQWVPIIGEAWDIIQSQPNVNVRIFPHNSQTYSWTFLKACRACGIVDLHAHDLRHEAASALIEAGWSIPDVALVTGHKDYRHLKRYVNLAPESTHDKVVPISKARRKA